MLGITKSPPRSVSRYGLPGCLAWGLRGCRGKMETCPPPHPKKETSPQQGWGLRMQVWWALSSPRVTCPHLPGSSFIGQLLCARCCTRLPGGRRGQGRLRIKAVMSSLCGCGTWGWQHCGGAAEIRATAYRALPGRLPGSGQVSPLGQAWWGSLPCAWEPQLQPSQADSAGWLGAGAPSRGFVVWMCEACGRGLWWPQPMGLRSVLYCLSEASP